MKILGLSNLAFVFMVEQILAKSQQSATSLHLVGRAFICASLTNL
jgi:hypothetical protein